MVSRQRFRSNDGFVIPAQAGIQARASAVFACLPDALGNSAFKCMAHNNNPPLPSPLPPLGRRGNKRNRRGGFIKRSRRSHKGDLVQPHPSPLSPLGSRFLCLPKVEELERGAHMLHSTSNLAVLKGTWSSGTLGTDEKTLCPLRLCGESSTFPQ